VGGRYEINIVNLIEKEVLFKMDVTHLGCLSALDYTSKIIIVAQATHRKGRHFPIVKIFSRKKKEQLFTFAITHYVQTHVRYSLDFSLMLVF